MDLDRGALASLDRRLLVELDREERFQTVRLPVSPATWKRYCDSAGISMGRAIVALINRELANVADLPVDDSPVVSCWRDERPRLRIGNERYQQPRRGSGAEVSVFVVGRPSYRHWRSASSWHRS